MYARGSGVERNHAWAVFWFVNAAQGGNELALENINISRKNLQVKEIAASRVNIRAGNSTAYERVGQLVRGSNVYVLGSTEGWSQVHFDSEQGPMLGWVSNTLIE